METQQIESIQNQPEITVTPTPYQEKPKSKLVSILLGITVLLLGAIYGILVSQLPKTKTNQTIQPTETPSIQPSIATNQPFSALATTSAFLTVKQSVASLSATITNATINDSSLNPPTLDLSLGLETK